MATDLMEFLRARLDEDEAVALATSDDVAERTWSADDNGYPGAGRVLDGLGRTLVYDEGRPVTEEALHIGRHDPARVLREVEAKRAIVGEQASDHAPIESAYGLTCRTCVAWQDDEGAHEFGIAIPEGWPCRVARSLAAVYSDHPDYQPGWKP